MNKYKDEQGNLITKEYIDENGDLVIEAETPEYTNFMLGKDARDAGKELNANPSSRPKARKLWNSWRMGWHFRDKELKRNGS